jgi:hypothetical protein
MTEMEFPRAWRSALVVIVVAGCASGPAGVGGQPASGTIAIPSQPSVGVSPGPTLTPSFIRPTPLPDPTFLAYAVRSGDTLTSIARAYRTTPRSIAFWSRDEHPSLDPESSAYDPNRLEIGWVLRVIPDAVFDEDQLPASTPTPASPAASDATPGSSTGAAPG